MSNLCFKFKFQLSTELMLVKKLINKDRNLYRKMDIRVSNVETCCDKTATELKEVKHSHQGLVEKVQRIQHEMQIGDFSILDSKNRTPLDEVQLLNEKLTETQHELWCRNKELEEYRLSTVSENNIIVQDKTNLLTAEKAKKELAVANEKLTAEVKQLQSELRQTKEHDIEKECTNTTCTSRIEALEYSHESLKSENESLRSTYDMKRLKANSAFEERNYNLEVQLANAYMDKEKSDTFIEELQTMNTQKEKQIQGLSQDINKISTEKDSLNVKKAELEVDLRKKEDEYQCLMQENTDLKATG